VCSSDLTVFSKYQYVCIRSCHLVNKSEYFLYRLAFANDIAKRFVDLLLQHLLCLLELVNLVVRLLEFDGRRNRSNEFFILPRLQNKIGGASLQCPHCHFNVAKGSDHDHNRGRIVCENLLEPVETFLATRDVLAEIHIQQNYIVAVIVQQERYLLRILLYDNVMALFFE